MVKVVKEKKEADSKKAQKKVSKKSREAKSSLKKASSVMKKGKILVIVESPAKSKTIGKILGSDYQIEASFGHIRDFPPKILGFDVENGFMPTYQVIPEKQHIVDKLNEFAQKSSKVLLASDPDREGEAIAWHVRQILDVPDEKVCRIVFNEITPKAIENAVNNCRQIDADKVRAQQTRQILDRLVGYKISPVLWKKMKNNRLSAGRVQSVALRMICEREQEIEAFVPQEYWSITANFKKEDKEFSAELAKIASKKVDIKTQQQAIEIVKQLNKKGLEYIVSNISKRKTTRKPSAPFITSTLQREASSKLGFGVARTMQVAQKLYEGLEIDGEPVGLITYMRTDSFRISDEAQVAAKDYITKVFSEKYYPEKPNIYTKSKSQNVQDAHEAIRPAYIERTPESLKDILTNEQYRLYKLIWDRFIASQMQNAQIENTTVDICADEFIFKTSTSKVIFDGFLKLYDENSKDENQKNDLKLPDLKKRDKVDLKKVEPKQHFTQPPARYSEATLVKALEEYGIGRPSTYAPIITKIQQKCYVEKIEKSLAPTILGKTVSQQLINYFVDIVNYKFTASLEKQLDEIADEKRVWTNVIEEFYKPFIEVVNNAQENMEDVRIDSGKICPNCSKPMLVKTSRFGTQFLGCSGYPECKTMMPMSCDEQKGCVQNEIADEKCEKCNSEMLIKFGPFGKYLQCTNEKCKHRKAVLKTIGVKCPKDGCEGELVQRKSRRGRIFYGCNKYPDCDFVSWNEPVNEKCPECSSILIKYITKKTSLLKCSNKECKFSKSLEEN